MNVQDGVAAAQRSMAGVQFPWPRAERPLMFLTQLGQEEIAPSGTSYLNRAGAQCIFHTVLLSIASR